MKRSPELIIGMAASAITLVIAVIAILIASARGKSNDYTKHMDLARFCLNLSWYESAIAEYKSAIALMPENTEAYLALAEVYTELEDNKAAIEILGQGIKKTNAEDLIVYLEIILRADREEQDRNLPGRLGAETESENPDNKVEGEKSETNKEIYYGDDGSYSVYEYNDNGNRVKSTYYLKDGTVVNYWLYEYDSNGNLVKEAYYLEDGTIVDYWIYEHDDNGNRVKMICYNTDGNIDYYSEYEYDSNGNRVKAIGYNADGSIISIDEYDTNGKKVKTTWYNADGTVSRVEFRGKK